MFKRIKALVCAVALACGVGVIVDAQSSGALMSLVGRTDASTNALAVALVSGSGSENTGAIGGLVGATDANNALKVFLDTSAGNPVFDGITLKDAYDNTVDLFGNWGGLGLGPAAGLTIYGTGGFDAANYEAVNFEWAGTTFQIRSDTGGTGQRRPIRLAGSAITFSIADSEKWTIDSSANLAPITDNSYDIGDTTHRVKNFYATGIVKTGSFTVGQLATCASSLAGARALVTDATTTTFMGSLTGGGTNKVPVFCDGSAWKIG